MPACRRSTTRDERGGIYGAKQRTSPITANLVGMSALEIEPAMTYRLQLRGPLESKDGAPPHPYIQYWEMVGATLDGPEIRATSAMPD